jgi:hypothetical protein
MNIAFFWFITVKSSCIWGIPNVLVYDFSTSAYLIYSQRFVCECGLYEHFGILCCHSLKASYEHYFFGIITVKSSCILGNSKRFSL